MTSYGRLILCFDGASRNNPHGPAGCGWHLCEMDDNGGESDFVDEGSHYLGYDVSNNQSEYQGLIEGLNYMIYNYIQCEALYIRGDSEIVINQINGDYEVRSSRIWPCYEEAMERLNQVDCGWYRISHVPRGRNYRADQLANEAIDSECY